MKIIQGSNSAIVVSFDCDISTASKVEAGLYHPLPHGKSEKLKEWHKEDITFYEETATIELPLTQAETLSFPTGACSLEIKALDSDEKVTLWNPIVGTIEERNNDAEM